MKPKRARARPAARARAKALRPRRWGTPVLVVALLAAGGLLWWWFGRVPSPPRSSAALDPQVAIQEAMTLTKQGRFVESLPMLKHVAEAAPLSSTGHHDYATSILNAVHQGRHHLGKDEFAIRSSVERIALMREALQELVKAEQAAGNDPRALAWARRTRAQAFGAWGFPWEALVAYRQAEWTDPTWKDIAGRADHVMTEMEHPEHVKASAH